jgi:hypothetical protein
VARTNARNGTADALGEKRILKLLSPDCLFALPILLLLLSSLFSNELRGGRVTGKGVALH